MTNLLDMRDAFFDSLYEYVAEDRDVIVMTADHGAFGLKKIAKDFPDQFYNVGISEQTMISVAAGLAMSGKKVYAYAINNFVSLKTIEQVNVDVCSMNLDVNIIAVGAGFTYSTDGPTHQGIQDVSVMCNVPNLSVYNVSDAVSTQKLVGLSYQKSGPKYFRIEKGILPSIYSDSDSIESGCSVINHASSNVGVISTGFMTHVCMDAISEIKSENNFDISLLDITSLRPLPEREIIEYCSGKDILIIEENIKSGGIGEKICALLKRSSHKNKVSCISIKDGFHFIFGDRELLHNICKIDKNSIKLKILTMSEESNVL